MEYCLDTSLIAFLVLGFNSSDVKNTNLQQAFTPAFTTKKAILTAKHTTKHDVTTEHPKKTEEEQENEFFGAGNILDPTILQILSRISSIGNLVLIIFLFSLNFVMNKLSCNIMTFFFLPQAGWISKTLQSEEMFLKVMKTN